MIPQAPAQGPNPFTDTPTNLLDKELSSHPRAADTPSPVPTYTYRWYRTKRGIAIIVLIFLIIVSVIVGVAVGVTNEKQKQAALAAQQSANVRSESDPLRTVAPTGSPSVAPTTSSIAVSRPSRTLDSPKSTSTPAAPTAPLVATQTPAGTTPQIVRPSTPVSPTSTGAANPSESGNAGGGRDDRPWYCKLLPFVC